MSSPSARTEFVRNATQLVQRGVEFESQQNYPVAVYFYTEAIYLLQRATDESSGPDEGDDAEQKFDNDTILKRISQYRDRISALQDGKNLTSHICCNASKTKIQAQFAQYVNKN